MSEMPAPAATYKLNVLASVVGRYAVPDLSPKTLAQVGEMLDMAIDDIRLYDVPEVPHTNPVLLEEAVAFDRKLLVQVVNGPASYQLAGSQRKIIERILHRHLDFCGDNIIQAGAWEGLASAHDIAIAYGLPDLWANPQQVIQEEVRRWGRDTTHPPTPALLSCRVKVQETRELMSLMWRKVIEIEREPNVHTYLTDDIQNYHVFWAPLAEKLDYATPATYDRATQLSFDLPHNATHLAHLDAMDQKSGAARYDDSMALRAYFEAVTVFSEQKMCEVASKDSEFGYELREIMHDGEGLSPEDLAAWILADRRYEFKLRAVRYAADILMIEGASFDDTVSEVGATFGIPKGDAVKEIRKYIAWTGLGATYTFGYRQLEALGIKRVVDAIKQSDGTALTSWMAASARLKDA